jgi:hypothetical protein
MREKLDGPSGDLSNHLVQILSVWFFFEPSGSLLTLSRPVLNPQRMLLRHLVRGDLVPFGTKLAKLRSKRCHYDKPMEDLKPNGVQSS